jgi:hypothetical protein
MSQQHHLVHINRGGVTMVGWASEVQRVINEHNSYDDDVDLNERDEWLAELAADLAHQILTDAGLGGLTWPDEDDLPDED